MTLSDDITGYLAELGITHEYVKSALLTLGYLGTPNRPDDSPIGAYVKDRVPNLSTLLVGAHSLVYARPLTPTHLIVMELSMPIRMFNRFFDAYRYPGLVNRIAKLRRAIGDPQDKVANTIQRAFPGAVEITNGGQ